MSRRPSLSIAAAALLPLLSGSTASSATFVGLGDFPGGAFRSSAFDVSANGSVVIGLSYSAEGDLPWAFRWTEQSGITGLGNMGGNISSSYASGVSGDGGTIVGTALTASGPQAFRWTVASGMTLLADLPGGVFYGHALGSSFDGSIVVGDGNTTAAGGQNGSRAVRWLSDGVANPIDDEDYSYSEGISADGLTIVGTQHHNTAPQAFRWTQADGMVGLGDLPDGVFESHAIALSSDGSAIVGRGSSASGKEAFLWTGATGLFGLGDLPGGAFESLAWDISGDGSLVVGTGRTDLGYEAFIWDRTNGIRNLREVLVSEYGLNLNGWKLLSARGISADGQTIVGEGTNPSGQSESWRVSGIPEPSASLLLLSSGIVLVGRRLHRRPRFHAASSTSAPKPFIRLPKLSPLHHGTSQQS